MDNDMMDAPPTPEKPRLVGTPTDTTITIKWEVHGNVSDVTHYTLNYRVAKEDGRRKQAWKDAATKDGIKVFQFNGLLPNTGYQFRVLSNSVVNWSHFSEVSDIIRTKMPNKVEKTASRVVENLSKGPLPQKPMLNGEPTHSTVALKWTVNGDTSSVTHYTVNYKAVEKNADMGSAGKWENFDTKDASCECVIGKLQPATSYRFYVSSNTEKGKGPPSPISDNICTQTDPAALALDHRVTSKQRQSYSAHFPNGGQNMRGADSSLSPLACQWNPNGSSYWMASNPGNFYPSYSDSSYTWGCNNRANVGSYAEYAPGYANGTTGMGTTMHSGKFANEIPPSPSKPLQTGTPTHNSVSLLWVVSGDSEPITHYTVIYRKCGKNGAYSGGSWKDIDTPTAAKRYTVDKLEAFTRYQFKIASNTLYEQSLPSQSSDIIQTVSAPSGKTTTNASRAVQDQPIVWPALGKPYMDGTATEDSVPLKWDVCGDPSNITHYTLDFKRPRDKRRWMTITTDEATNSFVVKDLDPDTAYHFRVSANCVQDQSRPSKLSNDIRTGRKRPGGSDTPSNRPPMPKAPTVVQKPGHDSLTLCWEVQGNTSRITHYTINFKIADDHGSARKGYWTTVETDDNMTTFTIDDLKPDTPYLFRVSANTEDCQSPPSSISNIVRTTKKTATDANSPKPPPTPQKPKAVGTPGQSQVHLKWKVPGQNNHITHSTMMFREVGQKHWVTFETEDAETYCTIEDLNPDTPYQFRVASNSDQCQSPPSEISNTVHTAKLAPTIPEQRPPKPYRLNRIGQPTPDTLTLTWNVEGDVSLISGFTLKYRVINEVTKDISATTPWAILHTGNSDTWCTLENLEPGTLYHICIEANTKDGNAYPSDSNDNFICTAATSTEPEEAEKESLDSSIPVQKPLPTPGAPRLTPGIRQTQTTMSVVWDDGTDGFSITHFTLGYKAVREKADWKEIEIPGVSCEYTLSSLQPETPYLIRVKTHTITESSGWSELGEPFFTEARSEDQLYREQLLSTCTPVESDKDMPLYQVPLELTEWNETERIRKNEFGTASDIPAPEKVLLVVGATGAGKSTLINGFFNYVVGVEWSEDFRFRLVEESGSFETQHQSQTKMITVYKLHHHKIFKIPYTLTIIDTPGFGDTAGISQDRLIVESIGHLFRKEVYGVDHIDAIGFVVQSSLARLTPTQQYIFDSILSLFGKDIGDNIFLNITFSDSAKPPVLASTKEAKIPYKSHYKFNNSALFAKNDTEDNEFDQMFWKMGALSFQKFLSEIETLEGKSLCLTKEVLDEREQLEVYVSGIQQEIRVGLNKLEQYRVEADVVKQHEADIEKNRDFHYSVQEHKMVKVDLAVGTHVTNCLTCNRTCHYPCGIPNDDGKRGCWAMDRNGYCRICSLNCYWSMHRNVPFRIEVETVTVKKTADDLKKRYEQAKGEKLNAEKLRNKILDDFYNLEVKVLYMTAEVRRGLERLSEIALRPNPLSTVQYLDILIRSERSEAKKGFEARVAQLENVKENAKALFDMTKDGYDPFDDFRDILNQAKAAQHRPSFQDAAAHFRKKHNFNSILKDTANRFFKMFQGH